MSAQITSSGSTSKLTSYLFNELRRTSAKYTVVTCKFSYSRIYKSGRFEIGNMSILFEDEPIHITDPNIREHVINKFNLITGPKIPSVDVLYEVKSQLNKVYVMANIFLPNSVNIHEKVEPKQKIIHGNTGKKKSPEFKEKRREIITKWWADKKAAKGG